MNGSLSDPDMWSRIEEYEFPEVDDMAFAEYVAEKTGYNSDDAEAMVYEIRRFVYLCVTCPGETRPSALVDEIWHIHLTLTKDYWERFCPEILCRKLHHNPGGPAPYQSPQFEATLEQYKQEFGDPPPERYWLPVRHLRVYRGLQIATVALFVAAVVLGWPGYVMFSIIFVFIVQFLIDRQRPQKQSADSGGCGASSGCGGD